MCGKGDCTHDTRWDALMGIKNRVELGVVEDMLCRINCAHGCAISGSTEGCEEGCTASNATLMDQIGGNFQRHISSLHCIQNFIEWSYTWKRIHVDRHGDGSLPLPFRIPARPSFRASSEHRTNFHSEVLLSQFFLSLPSSRSHRRM